MLLQQASILRSTARTPQVQGDRLPLALCLRTLSVTSALYISLCLSSRTRTFHRRLFDYPPYRTLSLAAALSFPPFVYTDFVAQSPAFALDLEQPRRVSYNPASRDSPFSGRLLLTLPVPCPHEQFLKLGLNRTHLSHSPIPSTTSGLDRSIPIGGWDLLANAGRLATIWAGNYTCCLHISPPYSVVKVSAWRPLFAAKHHLSSLAPRMI